MNNWQPIETAPKGGCQILVFNPIRGVEIRQWNTECHAAHPKPFWDHYGVWGKMSNRATQPTHWQPLPEKPCE